MPPGPIPPTPHRPGRRHTTFSPRQLQLYRACPERYYRTYIGNEKFHAAFNPGMLRGSAVHKVLARAFEARQDGEIIDDLRPWATLFLPRSLYAKAGALEEWTTDLELVIALSKIGLARVPVNASIVSIERSFSTVLPTSSPVAGATLAGKVDLLVRHPGGPLEHIEFKTGSAGPDPYQEVICRIGVCSEHNVRGDELKSTTMQLTTGADYVIGGDRTQLVIVLAEIEETVAEIWGATRWPARENDRCQFCEYRDTVCSHFGEWSRPNRLAERAVPAVEPSDNDTP